MTKFEDAVKALADQRRERFLTCKPSELIMLALEDLEKVEGTPKVYHVNMDIVHDQIKELCYVCLAGAVLAQTMRVDPTEHWSQAHPCEETTDRVWALDDFRQGEIGKGLAKMNIKLPHNVREKISVLDYAFDPVEFKSGLRWIAKHLAERGL